MGHACRQDGNYAGHIRNGGTVIDADTGTGDYLVGFQLRLVDMILNTFARCNADKVIAELPAGVFGGNDVFELHAVKGRVLFPWKVCKCGCRFRQSQRTVVKCFK